VAEASTQSAALKSFEWLSGLVDRPEIESRLVQVVGDDPTHIGILDTTRYEERQERILIVQPTAEVGVVELYFQDGAGYEGLIGTLTLAQDGQKGMRS
jgi:hypothetical protein